MPSSTPIDVTCTQFAGIRPVVQDTWSGTWASFTEEVLLSLVAQRSTVKTRCPGFVLAEVNGKRSEANVGAHTALVIDVDAIPDNDLGALLKRASRYRSAVYETPSSTD